MRYFSLFAGLALAACGSGDASVDANSDAKSAAVPVVVVATAAPTQGTQTLTAIGTVRLREETELAFTTAGRIASVAVEPGERVRRGQRLAALDMTTVSADLESARAEQRRAASDLSRNRQLLKDGWVTQARIDDLEAAARAANAQVEASGFASRTARIDAPSSGIILERIGEPGQTVQGGDAILVLGSEAKGYVLRVPLTDRLAAGRQIGEAASVTVAALDVDAIPARLTELAGRADPATGTFAAEFTLDQQDGLRSGQVGRVTLSAPAETGDIIVPSSALFAARAGEALVWVFDPETGTVETRSVTPGPLTNAGLTITDGLAAGEQIVVAGLDELAQGAKVEVR
ncbi:MAG: efflux RND transporter periplasmic adaptor subunit [Pacificimonas sp.]